MQCDADADDTRSQNDRVAPHPLQSALSSKAGVQPTILYRFGDVLGGDHAPSAKVRNRARDLEDAMVRARRQQQARQRMAKKLITLAVGRAVAIDFPGAEQRI